MLKVEQIITYQKEEADNNGCQCDVHSPLYHKAAPLGCASVCASAAYKAFKTSINPCAIWH